MKRCRWAASTPDYVVYHDEEWGRPVVDDTRLYEKLCLEGFQSGLSWLTILRKREAFRRAFAGFDASKVARYTQRETDPSTGVVTGGADRKPSPPGNAGGSETRTRTEVGANADDGGSASPKGEAA